MDAIKLNKLKTHLLKDVNCPKLVQFYNTSFKNMETYPETVVSGCTELITTGSVKDLNSSYILGTVAGIALCMALDRKG